jgi:hypothetical protein
MFIVKENGHPCVMPGEWWGNANHNTFSLALAYCKKWLSDYRMATVPKDWDGKRYNYDGRGSMIEIVEEQ